MKFRIPQEITSFTTAAAEKRAGIVRLEADIGRAGTAAREAERLEGELQDLSNKRARLKAQAFIDGKKADLAELDRQEGELEKASRRAREDGKAGALAIEMLQEKIDESEAEIADLIEQRKTATLEWLEARGDAVMSEFIAALEALSPIVAQAIALAHARTRVSGDMRYNNLADSLRCHEWEFPIPYSHQEDIPGRPGVRRTPLRWLQRKGELGNAESEALIGDLRTVGVLQ